MGGFEFEVSGVFFFFNAVNEVGRGRRLGGWAGWSGESGGKWVVYFVYR